jgi:hypothetical protein
MTRPDDHGKIMALADLLLQHRLGQMRRTSALLERSRAQMAAIDQGAAAADLPDVMAERVACDYRRWADARKAELNEVLARQTLDVIAAREEAQYAFGRMQALRGIAARLQGRR